MTQQEVASALGVSYQSIWTWESGRHEISRDHLQSLLALYGLSDADFDLGDVAEPTGSSEQADRIALGRRMTKLREDANLSQNDVAVHMSGTNTLRYVDRSEIARYETGTTRPESDFLETFANLLGLTLETLFEGPDTNPPSRIELRGFVPAGLNQPTNEFSAFADSLQEKFPGVFEMVISGSDLESDGMRDGDRIFVDPNANIAVGKLFAIRLYNNVVVRPILIDEDGEVIVSSNETEGTGPKISSPNVEILGRVIGIFQPI